MAASDKEFGKFLSEFKKKYPELSKSLIEVATDPNSTQEDIDRAANDAKLLIDAFKKTGYNGVPGIRMFEYFGDEEFKGFTPEKNKKRIERAGLKSKHSESSGLDAEYSKKYNPNLEDYKSDGRSAIQYVTTDSLVGAEGNEIRDQRTVDDIAKDLEDGIGFKEPIVVVLDTKTGKAFVTEGNHRLAAARKAGVEYVPIRIVNSQDSEGNAYKLSSVGKYVASRDKLNKIDEKQDTIMPSEIFDDSQLLPEDTEGFAQAAGKPERLDRDASARKFTPSTTEKDSKKGITRWSREQDGLKADITYDGERFAVTYSDDPEEEIDLGINSTAAFKEAERQIMLKTAEFDTVDLEGFAQQEGNAPKRHRVLEAIAAVSNALGLFDEWKGKTTKAREDVNNVGEFVNNMRYVKGDLQKAIDNLKNSRGVEEKMAAISELTAAIKKAKLAAKIAKDRWKRNHPEDLKPKAPKTPKAIEAPTVEKVSKKFNDDLDVASSSLGVSEDLQIAIDKWENTQARIDRMSQGMVQFDENGNRLNTDGTPIKGLDTEGFAQSTAVVDVPTTKVSAKDYEAKKAKAIADNKSAAADMLKIFRKRITDPRGAQYDKPYSDYPADDPMSAPVNPSNMPFNPSSEHQYSGINHHVLAAAAAERGYTDPRWMTALQAKKMGATPRAGEQGVTITTYQAVENEDTGERVFVAVPRVVFNAEQMDGLEPYDPKQKPTMDAAQALEFVLGRFEEAEKKRGKSGRIKFWEDLVGTGDPEEDTPKWSPGGRRGENIKMPDRSKYDSPEDYLYSLFHELAHATGTRGRQAREAHLAQERGEMTKPQLTVEESVAEIASQLLLQRLGLPYNPDRTAEYLRSHRLTDEQLMQAMAHAELAVEYVLGNDVLPPWINSSTDLMEAAGVPGYTPPTTRSWNPNPNLGPQDAPSAYPPGTPGSDENPEVTGFAQKPGKFDRTGKKSVSDSKSAVDKVTAQLLEKLKEGQTPWRRPYKDGEKYAGALGLPRNPSSKHIYSGANAMILRLTQDIMGYSDPRWMTYKQAESMGGQVRKGEKGTFILVPMRIVQKDEQDPSKTRSFTMFKAMAVFNAEQIDGLSLPDISTESLPKMAPLEAQEFIVERYKKAMAARTGAAPVIKNKYVGQGGHQAPSWGQLTDEITLPNPEQFESSEDMFDTLMHELVHSTGHPDRLDRSDLTKDYGNPDGISRAREELIAEIGSAILGNMFGVDATFDNSAAYVQSWLQRLQSHPEEVVNASSQAQKAVDYILGTDLGDWSPIDGYSLGNAVQKPQENEEDQE